MYVQYVHDDVGQMKYMNIHSAMSKLVSLIIVNVVYIYNIKIKLIIHITFEIVEVKYLE